MGIFKRNLSLESQDGGEFTPEVEVDEVIEATTDNDEVNEVASEIQADVAAVEEAEDVIDELNEQVEENEEALETPEAVEAVDVAVSQEALNYATKRLGTTMSEMGLGVISRESAKDDSVTALRLSTEGIKDFINTVIEQIKRLMRNVANAFKKLYVKAITVFNNTEKAAKKLQEKVKNYQDGKEKLSDDDKKWFASKTAFILFNGSFDKNSIENFIDNSNNIAFATQAVNTLKEVIDKATTASKEEIEADAKITDKLKGQISGDKPLFTAADGGSKYVRYTVENADSMKTLSLKKEVKDADDNESKVSAKLSLSDVDSILKKLIAKGNRKYYDAMKKEIEDLEKSAKKVYETISKTTDWSQDARSKLIRTTSKTLTISTSICLDAIIYNLRANKNMLAVASKSLSLHDVKIK